MTRLLALLLILLVVAPLAGAQTDPSKPPFQTVPILGVSPSNTLVRFGDATNNAIRVNVVAGSACDNYATVSLTAAGNTQVITGTAGQSVRICSLVLVVASATAVSVIEGSGTLCNTNTTGLIGGAATGNGLNLASNGGLTMGTGLGEIAKVQQAGDNVCLGNSTAAVVAGGIKWTSY